MPIDFWEQPERVEHFASRPPDTRLVKLLESYEDPSRIRVLDVGCAGGRNTLLLAELGFDVYAFDSSAVMVQKTRECVAAIYGKWEARRRIQEGTMQNLQQFEEKSFHLIVALGIYHNATCRPMWEAALKESSRVLKHDGLLLTSNFSPASQPEGKPLIPIPAEPHVYRGFSAGPMFLLNADDLDQEMACVRLSPKVPTETVIVKTDTGRRVTVNALYVKTSV